MSDLFKKIESDALSLSIQQRAFLADRLLSSLNEDTLTAIDISWITEAERRYQDYKEGNRPGIAAKEVFAKADKMLK